MNNKYIFSNTIVLRCTEGYKDSSKMPEIARISKQRYKQILKGDEQPSTNELIGLCRACEVTLSDLHTTLDAVSGYESETTDLANLIATEDAESIVDLFTLGNLYVQDGKLFFSKDKLEVNSEDATKICRILFNHNYILTACRVPEFYKILGFDSVSKCKELGAKVLSLALTNPAYALDSNASLYNSQSVAFLNFLPTPDRRYVMSEIYNGTLDSAKEINATLSKKRLAFYEDFGFLMSIAKFTRLEDLEGVKECDDIFKAYYKTLVEMTNKILSDKRMVPAK